MGWWASSAVVVVLVSHLLAWRGRVSTRRGVRGPLGAWHLTGVILPLLGVVQEMRENAQYMGHWQAQPTGLGAVNWQHSTTWTGGALVRHHRRIYVAATPTVHAEPAHLPSRLYYLVFSDPVRVMSVIALFQVSGSAVLETWQSAREGGIWCGRGSL